jgi:predicted nucleic acid-binding protein
VSMSLIDTSAWIHALRPDGDVEVTVRVRSALELGEAAWCPLVQLELWNGARGDHEKTVLRELSQVLPDLAIDDAVWHAAYSLARDARKRGVTAPATDIMVVACARRHSVPLVHADAHFDLIQKA